MRKLHFISLVLVSILSTNLFAQKDITFSHVEPPFWWAGMKESELQIMFHNETTDFTNYKVSLDYPGAKIKEVTIPENPHFIFVTLDIANAKAGVLSFLFTEGKKKFKYAYTLKERENKTKALGVTSADVVYLIMPDRFANGDPTNDNIKGMHEGLERDKPFGRHGGDIKGINDHLDYIEDLGVTALWLNPVLENNQEKGSYHGYAITDLYTVDRRFGSNDTYKNFIENSHQKGIKVIQDMVMNHIGLGHWFMKDMPTKDWVHQFPEFTQTNFRAHVISDPYKSSSDSVKMSNGWFVKDMPDVNQSNPLFARYLIQNSIWWIEFAGIDGIRQDTHPYPDKNFMADWINAIVAEYPSFYIVGEVWMGNIPHIAYWQKGVNNKDGYQPAMPSVTDFPLCFAIAQALTENAGWETGVGKLYNVLSQDFIYPDANHNLTFVDNHDMTRFFLLVNRDLKKFKQGIGFLLTTRGIPQLYYGTELLMDGDAASHPDVRKDFPGGWESDAQNAFTAEGRTPEQNEAFDFMRTLLNWRKGEELIHSGKLTHFVPQDDVYVYFRHDNDRAVMVLINGSSKEVNVKTDRFAEITSNYKTAVDVITEKEFTSIESLSIGANEILILELK